MTQNQIAYHANLERARANRAQEDIQMKNLEHQQKVLKWEREKFNRSNWHQAIKNVGGGLSGPLKLFFR